MEATARLKVPGGKMLSVRLEHDGLRITGAEVSGDFFLYPEESITVLEAALVGAPLSAGEDELAMIIGSVMERNGISAVGFSPRDLALVIRGALG